MFTLSFCVICTDFVLFFFVCFDNVIIIALNVLVNAVVLCLLPFFYMLPVNAVIIRIKKGVFKRIFLLPLNIPYKPAP